MDSPYAYDNWVFDRRGALVRASYWQRPLAPHDKPAQHVLGARAHSPPLAMQAPASSACVAAIPCAHCAVWLCVVMS